MPKTARLELRVEPELKARLVAECDRRGMKVATFVVRALESALGGSSTAEQPRRREPNSRVAGSTPVPPAPSRASVPGPGGQGGPESMLPRVPGVRPARAFVLDPRQAALNRAKKS